MDIFSIFEGGLKTAQPMRKPVIIFGNDFLQRIPVMGLGFEGECEFFGMRLGRGSFETRKTYTTISLKSLSNFKNPTDGFEIETVKGLRVRPYCKKKLERD